MPIIRSVGALALTFLLIAVVSAAQAPAQQDPVFEGTFETLRAEQRQLVEDWVRRLEAATQQKINPAGLYDTLPLATRTTFNAVTHALMQTSLTDEQGQSLGASALTLISRIDGVAGRVVGARGDEQFRIYVQVAPDGLERLDRSREFGRGSDNTIYHRGYPISYRSRGGTPSIQLSLARVGTIGDIDVDYRPSVFPVSLVNGHLASSNSDIRAGGNDERHNGRWTGMNPWWRDLLGLVSSNEEEAASTPTLTQIQNIKKNSRPEEAMQAFLATWLVERRPAEIVSFFADDTIACMELTSGKPVDRGMLRFSILRSLQANNEEIGQVSSVSQVTQGVQTLGSRIRKLADGPANAFTLYDVREDLAEELKCGTRRDPEDVSPMALKSRKYGKYVGAVFQTKLGPTAGQTFALLLTKESGYWKILSYTNDPIGDAARSISLVQSTQDAMPAPALIAGDPEFLRAATDFHKQWFERRRFDLALTHLAPQSLPCIGLYLDEGVARPTTADEQRQLIKTGMQRSASPAGGARKLDQAIIAPEVHHPDLRVVRHGNSRAFAAAALPDALATRLGCEVAQTAAPGTQTSTASGLPADGTYFITGFKMANAVEDPGTLVCVWRKLDGAWKVVSFAILTA